MAVLTTKARNAFGPMKFGLPGKRAYPIESPAHAADAKARASEEFNKGRLSASQKAEVDARANKVLR